MGVWGKLGGAGIGALLGGPLGALAGAVAGHALFDRAGAIGGALLTSIIGPSPPDVVFATGLVALSAKMAKADGVVTQDEISAFRRIVVVSDADLPKVTKLFDLARETSAGFEAYAKQLADRFGNDPALLESVLDGLFEIAKADHAIHEAETRYLRAVASVFGIDEAGFRRIEARHVRHPDDPYTVIGVDRGMTNAALVAAYRKLVAESHPDRLIAAGLPEEAIAIATQRMAAINAAFDEIKRERKL